MNETEKKEAGDKKIEVPPKKPKDQKDPKIFHNINLGVTVIPVP